MDKIQVTLNPNQYFTDTSGRTFDSQVSMSRAIPPQLSSEAEVVIAAGAAAASEGV